MLLLFVPVALAPAQGVVVAALWVAITLAVGGYKPSRTRTLPSKDAIVPLLCAWVGSSAAVVALLAALDLPLAGEPDFLVGVLTCIGGWRYFYAGFLPLP